MPSFEYTAVDPTGRSETGTVLGLNINDALRQLVDKGLTVEKINTASFVGDPLAEELPPIAVERPAVEVQAPPVATAVPEPPPTEARSYFETNVVGAVVGGVGLSALMFFFRQFGTMIEAGVPMVQSLDSLTTQARDPRLKHVLAEIKGHVLAGRPISAGMQRYPEIFSPLHMSMIRAGEEGGFLAKACKQVATYIEQEIKIRQQYKRALFMPKLTVYSSIVIILAANWFIISFTEGNTIWSPLTTPSTWLILAPLIVGTWLWFKVGLKNPALRYKWDAFILKIPYLGNTLEQFAMAKFGRAFGALYAGGVSVQKSITLAADACGNEYLRAQIHPAARRLEEGSPITETLASTNAFTPLVLDMLHTGETTGNVDSMLNKVSEYYEDEADVRSQQLGKVAGAVAVILVGIYVLIVLVKFYSGYFSSMLNAAGG